jgi:AraC-like DNA-binding protein
MQKVVFNSAQLPGDDRLRKEAWIDTLASSVARLTLDPAPGVRFDGLLEVMPLHGGAVCTVGATISNILHASADVAIDGLDTIVFMVSVNRTPLKLSQQHNDIELTYGEAVLFDQMQWTRLSANGTDMSRVIGIRVPRELVRQQLSHLEDRFFVPVPAHSRSLTLVRAYVDALLAESGPYDPLLAKLAIGHLADLVAVAASGREVPDEQTGGHRTARLIAIGQCIDRGFEDPEFSLATLAQRLGVTPRQVQRLLADSQSSFVDEVMQRRLRRAREMLTSKRYAHMNIIAIAHECGFSTVSHFHRVFRGHFGATPGEVREQARSQGAARGL